MNLEFLFHILMSLCSLGDSGFAQEPWILTPFAREEEPAENTPEMRFNRDFCRDRCTIERTIGVMKQKFRYMLASYIFTLANLFLQL